jgi:hypothetical protein
VSEGSEFVARVCAAVNARDRGAIKARTAPDIVVGTTVEAYRGPEAVASMRQRGRGKASGAEVDHSFTHVWRCR